jgi:energy-coupling factor transporter ATP-binding protein EcfA2
MEKVISDKVARAWLIDQMRLSIQRPAVKPGNAIVLIGRQGTGKSTFYRIWKSILGDSNAAYLGGGLNSAFNDVMVKSLLIGWDEFEINHHKDVKEYNLLKTWITEPRISVNPKGKPAFEVNSYHRFVFTSNSMRPISLPPEDRRFFIYSIGESLRENKEFFTKLYTIIDPAHTYAQPMAENIRLAAMNGLMQWLRSSAITTNPLEVMATETKREMATANALVIEIFRQMYDDQELPQFIRDFMDPSEAAMFGKAAIRLPQMRFGQAMEKFYGRKHADAAEVKILKKYFMVLAANGIDSKGYHLSYKDQGGNMVSHVGKAYVLPPIAEGRAKLEEIMGMKLNWSGPVSQFEEDDNTNVIALAKKDSVI